MGEEYVLFGSQYVLPEENVLTMKEPKLALTTDYDITDKDGNKLFRIAAKTLTMHNAKILYDAEDNALASTSAKIFTIHDTVYLCPGEDADRDNFILKAEKRLLGVTPKINVYLRDNETEDPDIIIEGGILEREFKIERSDGLFLGEVSHQFTVMDIVADIDSFLIRVPAGIDTALVIALALIVDEIYTEGTED